MVNPITNGRIICCKTCNNKWTFNNIFKEEELDEKTSVGISDKSTGGRKSKIYNLDVIISVGYRVKSIKGVIFWKWVNKVLKEYLLRRYVTNENYVRLINKVDSLDERLVLLRTNINQLNLKTHNFFRWTALWCICINEWLNNLLFLNKRMY